MKTKLPKARKTPNGIVYAEKFNSTSKIPSHTDVVIIGGGVCGITTAWFLAKKGVSVTLCEKGEISCESSSKAYGLISELLLDANKMELSAESKRLWKELQAECGDTGYRQNGIVYVANSEEDMGFYDFWLNSVKGLCDVGNKILTPKELMKRFPRSTQNWKGGIFSPTDGGIEPTIATTTIAKACQKLGVKIITNCAVRTVDRKAGLISGVYTEHGYISASTVVYAGNTWSRLFCGNMGLDVPQLYVNMSMGSTGPLPDGPTGCGGADTWGWRQRIDGSYSLGRPIGAKAPLTRDSIQLFSRFRTLMNQEKAMGTKLSFGKDMINDWLLPRKWAEDKISPFEKTRILGASIDKTVPQLSLELNQKSFPAFNNTEVEEYWTGAVTVTPDNMPIASSIESIPGFYLITGCSYGLTWAPALGKLVSDMITKDVMTIDPKPYKYERFIDGSELTVSH